MCIYEYKIDSCAFFDIKQNIMHFFMDYKILRCDMAINSQQKSQEIHRKKALKQAKSLCI